MITNNDGKGYTYFQASAQPDTYDPNRPTPFQKLPLELKDSIVEYVRGSHAAKYPYEKP